MRAAAVALALLIGANSAIVAAHVWARREAPGAPPAVPVRNFAVVDDRVWRGGAPSERGYSALAEAGVRTVVDLRAERDLAVDEKALTALGIRRVHLPVRDGQIPSAHQVERFLDAVRTSPGPAYLHCGAGVGRTGAMAAAYLVATGQAAASDAVRRNLAVGPPSLEQIAFAAGLDGTEAQRPPAALVAVSRVLDAPRRIWVQLRRAYI